MSYSLNEAIEIVLPVLYEHAVAHDDGQVLEATEELHMLMIRCNNAKKAKDPTVFFVS